MYFIIWEDKGERRLYPATSALPAIHGYTQPKPLDAWMAASR
jgi:hypothetical protein